MNNSVYTHFSLILRVYTISIQGLRVMWTFWNTSQHCLLLDQLCDCHVTTVWHSCDHHLTVHYLSLSWLGACISACIITRKSYLFFWRYFAILTYRITKNFRDKRISRILEYRESFFRKISGNVHVSVDAMPFRETFFRKTLLHCVSRKVFVAKVFSWAENAILAHAY